MVETGSRIYLCHPNGTLITQLNGIQLNTVSLSEHYKEYDSLTFTVDQYITTDDGIQIQSNGYDDLSVYMGLYLEGIGYFQMQEPEVNHDGYVETKTITAYSIEREFENKRLSGFKVNKGTTDSMEYLAQNNVDDMGFAKEYVILYRSNRPELSLMHLVLEKMPGWSIGYVSEVLKDNESKKISVEADDTNIYGFLNSVVAPKLSILFQFDILHKTLIAFDKDDIGKDTNVFIGMRNLMNTVSISCDDSSVYTRFIVSGDEDLDIRNVNFGDNSIVNIDYFLKTSRYISSKLAEKLKIWMDYRDSKRLDYVELSKQTVDLESKIEEIVHRAPNDGCDWKQWDDMTEELLNKNLKYYQTFLISLQVSVDPDPQYTKPTDGTEPEYIPWKKPDGSINHEKYMDLLYKKANGYGGYYTYIQVKDYILPNIQIAIDNLLIPDKEDKHDYNKEFETNWDLYGIDLLNAKKESYENLLKTLAGFEKPWNELTDDEKAKHPTGENDYNIEHKKYVEISGYLGSETIAGSLLYKLKQLTDEVAVLKDKQNVIKQSRIDMIADVSLENEKFQFSKDDRVIYNTLLYDQTYTNSNIVTTSIDTTLTTIDVQETLYQDALDKLSEVSQPQYKFSTEMDNLLRLEEFKCWRGEFVLGNFVRLGVRDDYSVKLRIIGRTWNPCEVTPELEVEFSNMITSRSGVSDLIQILDNEDERGSTGGGIALGTGDSKDDKEYLTTLLQKMIANNLFSNAVTNISGSIKLSQAEIDQIISKYGKFATIDVGKIIGDEASFNKFFSEYVDADYIAARIVIGDTADFKEIKGDLALLKRVVTGQIIGDEGIFLELTTGNTHISEAVIKELIASKISVADLMTHTASAEIITLISTETGMPAIGFKDGTMQFYDKEGNIRLQIGQDGLGDYNFVIRGIDGKTALFDENGVTSEGIRDGLIKNDMLGDNQITPSKLSFDVEVDENGKIITDIEQILMGDGGKFGVHYSQFQESVTSTTTALDQKIDESLVYNVEIWSSNGNFFKNGEISTTLSCHVYKSNIDITDQLNAAAFHWVKINSDGTPDEEWNARHFGGTKEINITKDDVWGRATFECHVDGIPTQNN